VESGNELRRFDGHTGGILSLDLSADGQFAISGAQDSTAIIWDVANGDLLRQFGGHQGVVNGVGFDDNDRVWSASQDGMAFHWSPLLDLKVLQDWTAANRQVRGLTCSEQELYLLVTNCEEDG
jgi:WD40 repeat protein